MKLAGYLDSIVRTMQLKTIKNTDGIKRNQVAYSIIDKRMNEVRWPRNKRRRMSP